MLGRNVICVRCVDCSCNNVAGGICLLDRKAVLVRTGGGGVMQVGAFERYIPLTLYLCISCTLSE